MWTFHTIYHPKIWGGRLIADLKGIVPPFENVGESWEISAVPGWVSVVKSDEGAGESLESLVKRLGEKLLGNANSIRFGDRFPLLIKFIDAASDLSVQVHPDDRMAEEEGLPNGKTEMWYIVASRPGAKVANGFCKPVDRGEYQSMLETGAIEEALRYMPTKAGMSFFIPAGRIHAIGGGNLICEIQQTSDTTYRLYDYRRRDDFGNLRELHTEKAFRALDFNDCGGEHLVCTVKGPDEKEILDTPKFSVNLLETKVGMERDYRSLDSFVIIIAVKGDVDLEQHDPDLMADPATVGVRSLLLREGEAVLIPASSAGLTIRPTSDSILLETFIRP